MKFKFHIISFFFNKIVLITAISLIAIQPVIEAYGVLSKPDYELVDSENSEESNDKENNEEQKKDKKIQFQIINHNLDYSEEISTLCFSDFNLYSDFVIEIPIPPPNLM